MKRFIIILMFSLFTLSLPVFAAENQENFAPSSIEGYVEYENGESLTITHLENGNRSSFNLSPETFIVDAVSGLPLALEDLAERRVVVYYSDRDNALLVLGNIQEDSLLPRFGRVESLDVSDGQIVVSLDGGSLLVTIEDESLIEPFMGNNIATIDKVNVGSDLLMWFPFVAASYPGQATAERTIILNHDITDGEYSQGNENGQSTEYSLGNGYAQNAYTHNDYGYDYPNGYAEAEFPEPPTAIINLAPALSLADALGRVHMDFYTENGITMVPLRQVAESMGFIVTWNNLNRSISLHHSDGQSFGTVILGQDFFEGHVLEATPAVRNDRAFVPVNFFEILLGM